MLEGWKGRESALGGSVHGQADRGEFRLVLCWHRGFGRWLLVGLG